MANNNSWNSSSTGNVPIVINTGTGSLNISSDASATTVNIATGGAVKGVTLGSTNSTSATTVQSGSGALAVTSTNGTLTINSGTGALSISSDASATTVNVATGGAVKTTTLGSTNSTSKTTVQAGSQGITLTGAVTSANAITITSGNMTLSSGNLVLPATTSSVGQITQSGQVILHTTAGSNTNIFVGGSAGNLTLSGTGNTCCGFGSGAAITSGGFNTFIGWGTGNTITTTGSNICINSAGVVGDANTMRLGSATGTGSLQLNKTFIHGIRGITTGNADAINVLVDSAGQLGTVSSSIRFKQNVQSLTDTKILQLRPVSFEYKQDGRKATGLIAEEVYEIMPELVAKNLEGEIESVKYQDLAVLLLVEVQKLRKELNELKKK